MFAAVFDKMIEAKQKQANKLVQYYKNRLAMAELESMSDKELSDIGIHRSQIKEVVYNR